MKKAILFLIVTSLLVSSQVQASSFKKLNKKGFYQVKSMNSGKSFIYYGGLRKTERKTAKRIYKDNPLKFYRRYKEELYLNGACVVKTKLKKNTLKIWGKVNYHRNNKKIKKPLGKYKFKLSKKVKYYGTGYGKSRISYGRKLLKKPVGLGFRFFVKKGKVYKVYINA